MDVHIPQVQHSGKRRQWKASNLFFVLAMGIGSIGFGYSANVMAVTLVQPTFLSYFGLNERSNANALISAMAALYYAGGTLAAFLVGPLAERFGRKWAISIAAIVTAIAGACLAVSVNVPMFMVFRFMSGAGIMSRAISHD